MGEMSFKRPFKKVINWLHLWLGLAASIVVMIVALTGSLLAFEDELELALFKQRHIVQVQQARLTPDSIYQVAAATLTGKKITRMFVDAEIDRSVEVRAGEKGKGLKVAYIDPYSGKVLFKGDYNKQFFQQVRSLHRYLSLASTGKIITGISCAICFFLTISGLILWWPANKHAIKQRFKIKWDAKGKRLNWDLHAVTGFYLSFFLLAITLTGLVWSYDWVENLLYKVAGGRPQKEARVKNTDKAKTVEPDVLETMYNETNRLYPFSGKVSFSFPEKNGQAVMMQKEKNSSVVRETDQAYFDSKSGKLIKQFPFSQMNNGTKVRRMILPIHTGSLLGLPGKIMACIVGLFTATLPISGMLIWLGKRKKNIRKSKKANPELSYAN